MLNLIVENLIVKSEIFKYFFDTTIKICISIQQDRNIARNLVLDRVVSASRSSPGLLTARPALPKDPPAAALRLARPVPLQLTRASGRASGH